MIEMFSTQKDDKDWELYQVEARHDWLIILCVGACIGTVVIGILYFTLF